MFNFIKTHFLPLGVGLFTLVQISGCSLLQGSSGSKLNGPISVPEKYIYYSHASDSTLAKEQALLINLMMVLDSDAKSPEEKSEVFYQIATVYDDLGLESMSRFMLMNSIVNKPGYSRPYELLGLYFLKDGRIAEASDAFDAAIELDTHNSSAYPYLNRAFTMYYTNHEKLALEDMSYFYNDDKYDPYRMLCLYFVESAVNGRNVAIKNLKERFDDYQNSVKKKQWGDNLVKLYLGYVSQDALFEDIASYKNDADLFQEHLCEAYFYIGKLALQNKQDKLAYDYFSLCRQTRKYSFLEYRNAYLEMKAIEKKYNLTSDIEPLE